MASYIFANVLTVKFVTLPVAALMVVTLVVERFDVPVTFRVPPRTEAAFKVVTFVVERFDVPVTFRVPPRTEAAFKVVTFVVERFDVPVTFRVPPRTEAAFKVVTFVVERFDVPVTFRDAPKNESAFRVVTLVVERFDVPDTFRPDRIPTDVMLGWSGCETTRATLAFATLPTKFDEFRFERPEAFPMYRSPVTVNRFAVPVTFRDPPRTDAAFSVVTFVVERFEFPDTFRPVRIPTDVTLG